MLAGGAMSSASTSRSRRSTGRTIVATNEVLPLLKEKSRLEAARLKKEKLILLERMVHFTEAAEQRIASKAQRSQKQSSSLDVSSQGDSR